MFLVGLGDGDRFLGPDRTVLPAADQIEQIARLEQRLGHFDLAQDGAGDALLVAAVADAVGEAVGEGPQIRVRPQIAHGGRAGLQSEVGPIAGDVGGGPKPVEQRHRLGRKIIAQGPAPHLVGAGRTDVVDNLDAFLARRVLIHRDRLGIGQGGQRLVGHGGQIVSHDQRRGHDAPHREMGLVFRGGHAAASDFQHVRIVPTPRPGGKSGRAVQINVRNHARISIANVVGCPPVIAQVRDHDRRLLHSRSRPQRQNTIGCPLFINPSLMRP